MAKYVSHPSISTRDSNINPRAKDQKIYLILSEIVYKYLTKQTIQKKKRKKRNSADRCK